MNGKKKYWKANFTVEYTLVMPLVMMVIFFIIFLTFYLHDRVVLEAISTEILMEKKEENWEEIASKYTFCSTNIRFDLKESVLKKEVSYQTDVVVWNVLGLSKILARDKNLELSGKQESNTLKATSFIRLCRLEEADKKEQ